MAKISAFVPEPKPQYDESNQRQIIEAIDTLKNQLNFSFQFDLKEEQDAFNYFMSLQYNIKINDTNKLM